MLELSEFDWIAISTLEDRSAQIAKFYAGAGDRMLQRDLNAVCQMGLVDRRYGEVRTRKYLMAAFLPARVQAGSGENDLAAGRHGPLARSQERRLPKDQASPAGFLKP